MKKPFGRKSKDKEGIKIEKTIPQERSLVDVDYNLKEMVWISKEFHGFIIKSRDIINNIHVKYTGENAVITDNDLKPLADIMH